MKVNVYTKLYRLFIVLTALAVFGLLLPQPVYAASPAIEILSVKADDSVRIRAKDFPGGQLFTVRMDVSGNQAINGIVVTETNTGAGGSFEETYRIPAELRGVKTISIRLESPQGYFAYNWFNNVNSTSGGGTTIPVTGAIGPNIKILGVKSNDMVTVRANGFPANQYFAVRVGPFYTFSKNYEVVDNIYSGNGGTFDFNVELPGITDNVEWVAIRLDSPQKYYAYNAFKNVSSGTTSSNPNGPVATNQCSVISVTPNKSLGKNAEFDAVWTVKNTSGKTWEPNEIDFKYLSGSKLYDNGRLFDLTKKVKDGEKISLVVDMTAPSKVGTYSMDWGLTMGKTTICELPLSITVK